MKTISLTQGKCAIVDDEDYSALAKYKWCAQKGGNTYYAIRPYKRNKGKRPIMLMHREILQVSKEMETDHINHNGLDNRRENLRVCTKAQNQKNSLPRKKGNSKYKGVSWDKKTQKWDVRIHHKGKQLFLGRYHNEIFAAGVYDEKAKELFGEFACLNFVIK